MPWKYLTCIFKTLPGLTITLFCSLIFILSLDAATAGTQPVYTWSVVPQFPTTVIHRDWTPLLKILEQKTGYRFRLKLYDSIPNFEKGFLEGEPDFAYMNPYHAVMARESQGYNPIIRDGKRLLTGILVVRKDSQIKSIKDLQGKRAAFPSPNAFGSSLYIRALLGEKEGIHIKPVYAGTHSNSYRLTLLNRVSAGGGVYRTLHKEKKAVQDKLMVIYETPGKPAHPICVHPRVPVQVSEAVRSAIFATSKTENGKRILKRVFLHNPIIANYKTDYQSLKAIHLDKYFVPN